MPATPLFVADLDALKSELRLTGSSSEDAATIIDRAVQEVRVGFYEALGASRVTQLVGYSATLTPTTDDELARSKATSIEVLWTKARLLRSLPSLFMDASGQVDQIWNEEGLTREASSREIDRAIEKIMAEVRAGLDDLDGTVNEGSFHVDVIGPTDRQHRPGETAFPYTGSDS